MYTIFFYFFLFTSLKFKRLWYNVHSTFIFRITVKPVLRGHPCDQECAAYKTGDLLKEVQFIY